MSTLVLAAALVLTATGVADDPDVRSGPLMETCIMCISFLGEEPPDPEYPYTIVTAYRCDPSPLSQAITLVGTPLARAPLSVPSVRGEEGWNCASCEGEGCDEWVFSGNLWASESICAVPSCGGGGGSEQVSAVVVAMLDAIAANQLDPLRAHLTRTEGTSIQLNEGRSAIQVLGCDGHVAAHMPIDPALLHRLSQLSVTQ